MQVADGTSLADALTQHPGAFNELAVSMIRAGQEGGFLEDVMERIAIFSEHQEDMKAKVVGAMAYPVFLLVVLVVCSTSWSFWCRCSSRSFKRLEEKASCRA